MRKTALAFLAVALAVPFAFASADSTGFTSPIAVSSPGGNSTIPQIAVSGNNVYLGWIDNTAGKFGAKISKSTNGGVSFGGEINLGTIGGATDNIRIASSGNIVGAVWQSFLANKSSIAFAKSDDNGTSFTSPVQISNSSRDSAFPQIVIEGTHVYVAWLDRTAGDVTNIFFAKSDDGGATFVQPTAITSHGGNSGIPKIYADGPHVYLLWEDDSGKNFDIFMATSNDSGSTFGQPVNISTNSGNSGAPQMAVSDGDIYVVWMDDSSGHFDILSSSSGDGGKTFATPVNVSRGSQDSGYPQIAASGREVYVVWTETVTDKNYDIYFAGSSDGGRTFGTPVNLSNDPGASGWPQVAYEGNVYVSWVDDSHGLYDVYIDKSSDGGSTFASPINVSNSTGGTWYNQMVATPDSVYLAWLGVGQQNSEIMFARSTTFVPEFGPVAPIVLSLSIVGVILLSRRLN